MEIEIIKQCVGSEMRPVLQECYRCIYRFNRSFNMCILDIMIDKLIKYMISIAQFEDGMFVDPDNLLIKDGVKDADRTIIVDENTWSPSAFSMTGKPGYKCVSKVSLAFVDGKIRRYNSRIKIVFKRNAIDAIIKINDDHIPQPDEVYLELKRRREKQKRRNDGGQDDANDTLQSPDSSNEPS